MAFPRRSNTFYVPKAQYYYFGETVNDHWAAIRCPYLPMFFVSRGRIQSNKPMVWKVLKMPLKINYMFELESAQAVTLSEFCSGSAS